MCLKDVTVNLEPLTIFAGPNSSGKSALFKALSTFTKLLWYPTHGGPHGDFNVEYGVGLDDVVWNRDSALPIIFEVWFSEQNSRNPDYMMELRRDYSGWNITRECFQLNGTWVDTSRGPFEAETSRGKKSWPYPWPRPYQAPLAYLTARFMNDSTAIQHIAPLQELRSRLGEARRYRPSASDIAAFVRPKVDGKKTRQFEVDETGRGLPLVLRELYTRDRKSFSQIEEVLRKLHPHITEIRFKSDWRGVGLFYKTTRSVDDIPATLESDGVLLTTFLLWRGHEAPANLKLCLEEPENGIQLSALKQRYDLLNYFTTEAPDRPQVQILVATHSRDFLNAIESRPDILRIVRVIEFSSTSGTAIHELGHYRQIDQLLTEFRDQMGDLWWSERMFRRPVD